MSGEADLFLGEKHYHLREGDGVKIPPRTTHKWDNTADETAKVIFAVTPPTF